MTEHVGDVANGDTIEEIAGKKEQANLVEDSQVGYGTFGEQGGLEEFSSLNIFMISAQSTLQFPFGAGDRKSIGIS